MDQDYQNQNTSVTPGVQSFNSQPTNANSGQYVNQSYTVDYVPNVPPVFNRGNGNSETMTNYASPFEEPVPAVSPVQPIPQNSTISEPIKSVTPNQLVNSVQPVMENVEQEPNVPVTEQSQSREITIPSSEGEEPTVVTVSNDIRKIEEHEITSDGLKFVGTIFIILMVFVILLPYISRMFS